MKILAIETSCDETAIALLEATGDLQNPAFKVLGNTLVSQIELHKEYGGVYPMLAKREHIKNLPVVLDATLKKAGVDPEAPHIDYIAVTYGPGLAPALWTGITFAEELGAKWGIPVVPINHMEGHIYSPLFKAKNILEFPALALLVSGGHTELVSIQNFGEYHILGKTRDDAVGEAFDKVARLLGLPYPGGPKISALAELHRLKGLTPTFILPRPMINSKDFDFSFSGLKTSILYTLQNVPEITEDIREDMSHSFEDTAIEVLLHKTKKALEGNQYKTLIVAGGVSMNKYLREELRTLILEFPETTLLIPEPSLTTDNAIMIGIAGFVEILRNPEALKKEKISANGNLSLETLNQ
jgi:N6-L-threonylcarbamoyladenine synthase